MPITQKRLLFLLFFLSGFCGLLYQVVWVRMCFASFGVITPVLSVVLSVFMFGLFAGSWAAGRLVKPLSEKTGLSTVWWYAAAELVIGMSALAVPRLFKLGETWLLTFGETDSRGYLLWSGLLIAASIFPWCFFMGTTFPFMMGFVQERDSRDTHSFSFLYLANSIGAMTGTLVSALVLIELLGFRGTLWVAAAVNFTIATIAGALGAKFPKPPGFTVKERAVQQSRTSAAPAWVASVLFLTGFTSMAMEVVWTRAFTPVLKTEVYSFALLLFTYLLATWIGSWRYRRALASRTLVANDRLMGWLAVASLVPVALNDPRLQHQPSVTLLSIFPFCALLGYLTPKLIDDYSQGRPKGAGFAYALNILGCILGPLFASYLLLPYLSVKEGMLLLAAPYLVLIFTHGTKPLLAERRWQTVALCWVLIFALTRHTYDERFSGPTTMVRRDHTATVVAAGSGMDKHLLVNGIGITSLVPVTKVMAHLPLALLPHPPRSALVICFGMGTTYRSLLTWNIDATAVELVGAVKDTFPFFFADAPQVLANPRGKIVIDDGRRFLMRTAERFDVITLDPPPPVEAAGSSLLYSEEFYAAARARLRPGGILQQWLPDAEPRIVTAVTRSVMNSFPYVRVLKVFDGGGGHHFLASDTPFRIPSAPEVLARMPEAARADLAEWRADKSAQAFLQEVVTKEASAEAIVRDGDMRILDDRPYNEYYLLRRKLMKKSRHDLSR